MNAIDLIGIVAKAVVGGSDNHAAAAEALLGAIKYVADAEAEVHGPSGFHAAAQQEARAESLKRSANIIREWVPWPAIEAAITCLRRT